MAGRKSDFTLPTNTLDDLFSTQEERDDAKLAKIRDIPLTEIDNFPDHPFKVRDDEDMLQLVESVKERGVITPATVRQKEDGRYELVSGHRKKRACELAGFEALRCEVVDLDRDAATVLMVESNYQRSQILPSEKAFAYKMRLEAMKRQAGRPSKENASPLATNFAQGRSDTELGEQVGESKDQVRRYIRLTNLVPELLDLVDGRTNLAKSTVEALRENFGCRIRIYRTTIPVAVKAAEVSSKGKSIYAYEPNSTVSKAYADFTKEVLADGRQKERLHASHEHAR